MWKKEFRSMLVPVLSRMSLLTVVFVFVAVRWFSTGTLPSVRNLLMAVLIIFWVLGLWVANHLGTQAFKAEFRDKAFEYFLSLPYSRARLLAFKLVPRLAVLASLVMIFEFILMFVNVPGKNISPILHPVYYPIWILLMFLIGFMLSFLESPNTRALGNFALFICFILIEMGVIALVSKLNNGQENVSYGAPFLASGVVILLATSYAFFRVARKFDLRVSTCFARSYLMAVFIPLTVLALTGLVSFIMVVTITPA